MMTTHDPVSGELPSFRLDGRLAVVTGASQGIGRTFALAFSRAGAELVLVGRNEERLRGAQRSIDSAGGRAHIICADLGKMEGIRSLEKEVSKIVAAKKQDLVLVNCAGFGFTKPALEITEQDWDHVLDVHAKATF